MDRPLRIALVVMICIPMVAAGGVSPIGQLWQMTLSVYTYYLGLESKPCICDGSRLQHLVSCFEGQTRTI